MIIQLELLAIVVRFGGEAIFALCYEVTYIHDACESGEESKIMSSLSKQFICNESYLFYRTHTK